MLRNLRLFIASPALVVLLISACSNNSGTVVVPAPTPVTSPTAQPTTEPFIFRFEPPVAIGPGTLYRFGRDLRLLITFAEPIEFETIPSPITVVGIEFSKVVPEARQLISTVEFTPTNPDQELPEAIITELTLDLVAESFNATIPTPSPSSSPISSPSPSVSISPSPNPNPSPSPSVAPPAPPAPVAGFSSSPVPDSTIAIASLINAEGSASITISETGNADLVVSGTLGGANPERFTVVPLATTVTNGGEPQTIEIRCTPTALGVVVTAQLELKTNDPNSPVVSYNLECRGPSDVVNSNADGVLATLAEDLSTCTLREAIAAVHATDNKFGGCEITTGTIQFANSLLNKTITITGSALPVIEEQLTIQGLGQNNLTISGGGAFRIFDISAGTAPVTIEALTLTQGKATNANGGAILSSDTGLLTINNVTISDSKATANISSGGNGGGVRAINVMVNNSIFNGNSAAEGGGGISASTATVSNSTFSGNTTLNSSGGGISASTATVSSSTLNSNKSGNLGGGIFATNNATVTNSTLNSNEAETLGGGINATNATVINSTLSANSASSNGGGIRADTATVTNSTIVLNRAADGGGIFRNGTYGTIVVNNTIVAGNTNVAGDTPNDISGTVNSSSSHNLIGSGGSGGLIAILLSALLTTTSSILSSTPWQTTAGRQKLMP